MQASTLWWVLAGITIVAELLTGGIYLLMLAIGTVAGALVAHLGGSVPVQMVAASAVGITSVLVCRRVRLRRSAELPPQRNPDINLDIGEAVHVQQWDTNGTARINYRGSQWTAVLRAGSLPAAGMHRIVEVQGSHLVVDKA